MGLSNSIDIRFGSILKADNTQSASRHLEYDSCAKADSDGESSVDTDESNDTMPMA